VCTQRDRQLPTPQLSAAAVGGGPPSTLSKRTSSEHQLPLSPSSGPKAAISDSPSSHHLQHHSATGPLIQNRSSASFSGPVSSRFRISRDNSASQQPPSLEVGTCATSSSSLPHLSSRVSNNEGLSQWLSENHWGGSLIEPGPSTQQGANGGAADVENLPMLQAGAAPCAPYHPSEQQHSIGMPHPQPIDEGKEEGEEDRCSSPTKRMPLCAVNLDRPREGRSLRVMASASGGLPPPTAASDRRSSCVALQPQPDTSLLRAGTGASSPGGLNDIAPVFSGGAASRESSEKLSRMSSMTLSMLPFQGFQGLGALKAIGQACRRRSSLYSTGSNEEQVCL